MIAAKRVTVVVIGSGMAGSGCASTLLKNGISCVVLEGDDHIGGRTQTISFTNENGDQLDIDTGACFIHGTKNNPIAEICESNGIPYRYTAVEGSTVSLSSDGTQLSHDKMIEINKLFRSLKSEVRYFMFIWIWIWIGYLRL